MNTLQVVADLCEVCRSLAAIIQVLSVSAANEDAVRQSGAFMEAETLYRRATGESLIDPPTDGGSKE